MTFFRGLMARATFDAGSLRRVGIGAAIGVLLALIGPMGSYAASLLSRILFWVPLLVIGTCAGELLARSTSRRPRLGEKRLLRLALVAGAVAAPMAVVSWLLAWAVFGPGKGGGLLYFLWAALLISGAMTTLMAALNSPGVETRAAPDSAVRLRERLPHQLRAAEIYAAASEDHYLRVYTAAGEAFILLRLADAVSELDGIAGAQVHRSWWVARAAVEGAERRGNGYSLILKSGLRAPVSRANVPVLRAEGWFGDSI